MIPTKVILLSILATLLLSSCNSVEQKHIDITATGHNKDGTVNIEYKKNGKYYSSFHISIDSLLTLIREAE